MSKADYIVNFSSKALGDGRIFPTHISLYTALICILKKNHFKSPFTVYRKELMCLAHISSISTYHKVIKDLQKFGYIIYEPSYNYFQGSKITIRYERIRR